MGELVYPIVGVCWWCGAPADSREHKYKRSDLVREFGRPPYAGGQQLVVVEEGGDVQRRGVHGPASQAFQFRANLCQRCNNERSQSFDQGYDTFIAYLVANARQIQRSREIDLKAVYGDSWPEDSANLVRYFVKHIGCRIADELIAQRVGIDADLIRFLDGGPVPACLRLDACLDSGAEALGRMLRASSAALRERNDGFLSTGPFWVEKHLRTGLMHTPQSNMRYRWFTLYWQINPSTTEPLNPFAGRIVHLKRTDEMMGWRNRLRMNALALVYKLPVLGSWYARRVIST